MLWPVHRAELKKIVPMLLLFFLISFIYHILRCMKLTLILTADGAGAEAVPFLKIGAVLPGAFLFTYIFTSISNKLSRSSVFYTMLGIFLTFFTVFLFIIYPNREQLELKALSNWFLTSNLMPAGYEGLAAIIRHWHLSLFYVVSELWSNIMLSMLFWGFANEITTISQAKRFYGLFALASNCSGIFSGQIAQLLKVNMFSKFIPYGNDVWEQTMFLQILAVVIISLFIFAIYFWLNRFGLESDLMVTETVAHNKVKKKKLSIRESFNFLRKSKYLTYIVVIVLAYNVVYNLVDVLWSSQLKQVFSTKNEVNAYINQMTSITGVTATLFAIFISGNVVSKFGWTIAALVCPCIWGLTSIGFFSGLLVESFNGSEILLNIVANPANFILILGSIQISLGRASKYTVFDETKEIAFIPLSQHEQRKAKAVVDGIASRLGKSGGALIYLLLFSIFDSLAASIPVVVVITVAMIVIWMFAVLKLGKIISSKVDKVQPKPEPVSTAQSSDDGDLVPSV